MSQDNKNLVWILAAAVLASGGGGTLGSLVAPQHECACAEGLDKLEAETKKLEGRLEKLEEVIRSACPVPSGEVTP